ncbi:hypothetical protein SARC_04341 [Sphaeroforma arctica JP610]|uniref:Cytochrome b5 heme-binding domain-containing protein n=1 Tax=Sphaeroforma arctica JP610 TaxID=667725 RepID=A0A0L0G2U6_9EUKA|nr:hypothetical protein SARC_04341 [Sphaeroforma arctica JP610]KNC83400.1 hypothetical protein SARC_04341 [Sphaeroforma arctica JP610]|eukprot:XP_014157302.1 hypothetical protein SARC_04341 [Sphaeroforma arctica JP610]
MFSRHIQSCLSRRTMTSASRRTTMRYAARGFASATSQHTHTHVRSQRLALRGISAVTGACLATYVYSSTTYPVAKQEGLLSSATEADASKEGAGIHELTPEETDELEPFTMDEVREHANKDDCWIIIDGVIYDVTSLLSQHPGGQAVLLSFGGKDVSAEYHAMKHSSQAQAMRPGLAVGRLILGAYTPVKIMTDIEEIIEEKAKTQKKRLVIVGGGICGASAAYFLSQNKTFSAEWDVALLEHDPIVGGTALRSSAIMWLGPLLEKTEIEEKPNGAIDVNVSQVGSTKPPMGLTQWLGEEAYLFFKTMQAEWGDVEFTDKGTIGLVETDEQLEGARAIFGADGKVRGAEIVTDKARMAEIEPAISPEQLKAIVYHPRGATVDPYMVCDAFAKRAQANGVRLLLDHAVTDIAPVEDSSMNYRVTCENGEQLDADVVVICTGWKAKEHAAMIGCDVPVKAMHGQMFAISHPDFKLNNNVYGLEGVTYWRKNKVKHQTTRENTAPYKRITSHLYGVQLANGVAKFGGDRVQANLDGIVLEDGIEDNYNTVTRLFPQLKGVPMLGSWSGVMPFTPDQKIICGALDDTGKAFVLTGSGFMRGLASGRLLAESITRVHVDNLPVYGIDTESVETKAKRDEIDFYLDDCSPQRFAKQKAAAEAMAAKEAEAA